MNRRIEVPIVIAALSVAMNVIFVLGLVIGMFTGNGISLVKPTLTPTATATATATATPTKTLTPTASPTRPPTATPVPCKADEVSGVDCTIDVGGLAVIVVSQQRIPVVYDGSSGQEVKPIDENHIWLVVILTLPSWTVGDDIKAWFEDGYTHTPMILDAAGNIYRMSGIWEEAVNDGVGMGIVFQVPKNAEGLTLIIQPGDEVDLSLVPDLTVADAANPVATPESSEIP